MITTLNFHTMVNLRCAINMISKFKMEGEWEYDQGKIQDYIEQYYVNFYKKRLPYRPILEGVDFDGIGEEQQRWLKRPFLEEEVKASLDSLLNDRTPDPNDFQTKFLKVCWDVVEKKVMVVIEAFHSHNQWCKSLSVTFITLIPKKKGSAEIKD